MCAERPTHIRLVHTPVALLNSTIRVITVVIAPMCLPNPIAIDPVTVFVSIWAMIGDNAS